MKYSSVVVVITALMLAACQGPAGPPGPQGAQGPAGPAGPSGKTPLRRVASDSSDASCAVDELLISGWCAKGGNPAIVSGQAGSPDSVHCPSPATAVAICTKQ